MTDSETTFLRFALKHHKLIWKKCKQQHIDYSLSNLKRFAAYDGNGERPITSIRASDVHIYMDHLIQDHGFTVATVNRHGVTISKIIRYAYDNDYVLRPISVDLYDEDNTRPMFFDDHMIAKILGYLKGYRDAPYVYHMSVLSLHTGMRLGEILQLHSGKANIWFDDDNDPWIHLPETKWNGKGKKKRDVPLNKDAAQAVKALEMLWDHYSEKAFYTAWRAMRRAVFGKDDHDVVFHIWRHTAATRFANDLNITSTVIGKMLGHSDLKTTNKYIKLKSETQKQVARQSQQLGMGRLVS